jgi:hypothetical protein
MATNHPNVPARRPDDGDHGTDRRQPARTRDREPATADHEGATDEVTGDRTGPGAGYDDEPVQERDRGGVS